jgi:hypothetical protein
MISTAEHIMLALLIVMVLISGYLTFTHIVLRNHQKVYDSWLFPAILAIFLQIYENAYL